MKKPVKPDLTPDCELKLADDLDRVAEDALVIFRATVRRIADRVKAGDLSSRDALILARTIDAAKVLSRRLRWQSLAQGVSNEPT